MPKVDYAVFIGRFQPFHNAHLKVVEEALKHAENLIIVIGSHNTPTTIRNPWTSEERKTMVQEGILNSHLRDQYGYWHLKNRIHTSALRDSTYNMDNWVASLQNEVGKIVPEGKSVSLIGHLKDDSSFYLDYFPQWGLIRVPNFDNLDATDIRTELFETGKVNRDLVPSGTADWIEADLKERSDYHKKLAAEHNFIKQYKAKWANAPYPPVFVTTDAVVVCRGHVLLVKRGINPGKGSYALPGGFLKPNDTIIESALRELKEETKLEFPKQDVRNSLQGSCVFDHPRRELRGRTVTHAFLFNLNPFLRSSRKFALPRVKGADDAAEAFWLPLNELAHNEHNFFSDHYHIINYFVGAKL